MRFVLLLSALLFTPSAAIATGEVVQPEKETHEVLGNAASWLERIQDLAETCGKEAQKDNQPVYVRTRVSRRHSVVTKHTYCGGSVRDAVVCLTKKMGVKCDLDTVKCEGGPPAVQTIRLKHHRTATKTIQPEPGSGKTWVDCENGVLAGCGYEKLEPTSPRCKLRGAILAYYKTPTTMGSIHGHVEFVCGVDQYCSVYNKPHDEPWPKPVADGCWYPAFANNEKGPK